MKSLAPTYPLPIVKGQAFEAEGRRKLGLDDERMPERSEAAAWGLDSDCSVKAVWRYASLQRVSHPTKGEGAGGGV